MKNQKTPIKTKGSVRSIIAAAPNGGLTDFASIFNQKFELTTSNLVIRDRAKAAIANDPLAESIIIALKNNVLGDRGIVLSMQYKDKTGAIDPKINAQLQQKWDDFTKAVNFSACGQLDFHTAQELALESILVNGESISMLHRGADFGKYGLKVEAVPVEYLDFSSSASVYEGVETDKYGKPIAYYFRDTGVNFAPATLTKVSATDVLHVFHRRFPRQTRGISHFINALSTLHQQNRLSLDEVTMQRLATLKSIFFKMEKDSDFTWGDDEIEAAGMISRKLSQGGIEVLPPGIDPVVADWGSNLRDNKDLAKRLQRGIAAGFGLSYNVVAKDWEATSFSSARMAELQDAPTYARHQQVLIDQFCAPLFAAWVFEQLDKRTIKGLSIKDLETVVSAGKWVSRGRIPVDELKAMKSSIENLRWGLTTRTHELSKSGRSFEEVVSKLVQEELFIKESYEKQGLDVPQRHPDDTPAVQDTTSL